MPAPVAGASTQLAWRSCSSSSRSTLDDQLPTLPKLTVSIVGRPNTGKSTLFNRLTRSKMAIVSNVPGTTRDRREGLGHIAGLPLNLIDTGGLDDRGAVSLSIQAQVEAAFATTDVVLFMLDARQGVTALDEHFAQWLRRRLAEPVRMRQKSVLLVANKTEGAHLSPQVLDTVADAARLGFGDPVLISAAHGDGLADLAQELIRLAGERGCRLEEATKSAKRKLFSRQGVEERVVQLAIMGRPNVGKSTLLNAFLKEERSITGPMPGLTRDAVHAEWLHKGRKFKLVDTAGLTRIRTDKKLLAGISEMSLISALNALRFAQVVMLVVEGPQGKFSRLELQLARRVLEEGRGLVIAANKVDLLEQPGEAREGGIRDFEAAVREHVGESLREFGDVPLVVCSGTELKGVGRLLNTVIDVHDAWSRRVDTGTLNYWLRDLMVTHALPRVDGKLLNLKYITQVKSRPPTFALFSNMAELPGHFERFLRTNIQKAFDLQGIPIRFLIRKTKGIDMSRGRTSTEEGVIVRK
ncbi:GTP-binding protein, partial [Ochromonadaceae sp. CCMP2298]